MGCTVLATLHSAALPNLDPVSMYRTALHNRTALSSTTLCVLQMLIICFCSNTGYILLLHVTIPVLFIAVALLLLSPPIPLSRSATPADLSTLSGSRTTSTSSSFYSSTNYVDLGLTAPEVAIGFSVYAPTLAPTPCTAGVYNSSTTDLTSGYGLLDSHPLMCMPSPPPSRSPSTADITSVGGLLYWRQLTCTA
jgi:hypothetical protein